MIGTARKKPIEIQFALFDGDNHREVLSFIYPDMSEDGLRGAEVMKLPIVISTLEGDMRADVGDYIIRGVKGECYPCKPDIFEATYDILRVRHDLYFGDAGDASQGRKRIVDEGDILRFCLGDAGDEDGGPPC